MNGTLTDLAYIAGFVDGEGCITVARTVVKGKVNSYAMSFRIVNTDLAVLEYINQVLGGTLAMRGSRHGNKELYTLNWCSKSARDVLFLLLPYLRIKRRQAELAIFYQDSIVGNHVDGEVKEIFYKMSKEMKQPV